MSLALTVFFNILTVTAELAFTYGLYCRHLFHIYFHTHKHTHLYSHLHGLVNHIMAIYYIFTSTVGHRTHHRGFLVTSHKKS